MGSQRGKRIQTSSTAEPDTETLSPISCEACRQRKCKCDRRLPFCSQCSQGSSKCIYPESGKRGLPLGYLNQLEQRLAETEAALYGALITLRSLSPTAVAQATAKPQSLDKSKAARMDEWSQLPLRHWPDMYNWEASMGDQFIIQQQGIAPTDSTGFDYNISASPATDSPTAHREGDIHASGPAIYPWQPSENTHIASPYDMHFQPTGMVSSPVYPSQTLKNPSQGSTVATPDRLPEFDNATVISESGKEKEQTTRADELSKSNPSIYF